MAWCASGPVDFGAIFGRRGGSPEPEPAHDGISYFGHRHGSAWIVRASASEASTQE